MSEFNSKYNRAVWFDVPVADLPRASNFYAALLKIQVHQEKYGDCAFAVLEHQDGNGGCLVPQPNQITSTGGILLYFNVDGRIRDAVAQANAWGGKILEPIHGIGPHGFRAVLLDSEGNRIALHSNSNQ